MNLMGDPMRVAVSEPMIDNNVVTFLLVAVLVLAIVFLIRRF
jgi:uncharacterized protein HemY